MHGHNTVTLERQHTNELTLCFELDDEERFAKKFLPQCEVDLAKPRCTQRCEDHERECHCPPVPANVCRARSWAAALCPVSSFDSSFRDGEPLAVFQVVAERVRALAICYGKLASLPPPPGYQEQAAGVAPRADFTIKRAVEMHRRRLECTTPDTEIGRYRYFGGAAPTECLHEPGQKVEMPEDSYSFLSRKKKYSLRHLHDVCDSIWGFIGAFKNTPGEKWEDFACNNRETVEQTITARLRERTFLSGEKKDHPESCGNKGWPSTCGGWIGEYERLKFVLEMFPALVQLVQPDGWGDEEEGEGENKWTEGDLIVVPAKGTEKQLRAQRRAGRDFSRGIEEHFNAAIAVQIEQLQGLAGESQDRLVMLQDTDDEDEEGGKGEGA